MRALFGYSRHIGGRKSAIGVLCSADLAVIGFKKHFQVFYSVVSLVAVYMIDFFLRAKSPSELSLHQIAMDSHAPAVRRSHRFVINSLVACLCVVSHARATAKLSSFLRAQRAYMKLFFAVYADKVYSVAAKGVTACFDKIFVAVCADKEFSSAAIRTGLAFGHNTRPVCNRLTANRARFGRFCHTMNILRGRA